MSIQSQVPADYPMMVAWEAYKASDEYSNTKRWAAHVEHVDGSLWAAFVMGWNCRAPLVTRWAAERGWTYLSPVPSPADLARLVEAARAMTECDLGLVPDPGYTCASCEAWHALTAALAPFTKEPTT